MGFLCISILHIILIITINRKHMNSFWKYTIGLVIEMAIRLAQQFISPSNNVIKGTGSKSSSEAK